MNLQHIDILDVVFQLIAFLFAISVHESAHAWMANLRGDPTARMLGRITLNPIKHIDLFGTLLLPAIAMLTHLQCSDGPNPRRWIRETSRTPYSMTFSLRWSGRSAISSLRAAPYLF